MSKFYGSYFRFGVAGNGKLPEELNSCIINLNWAKIMPASDGQPDMEVLKAYKTQLENLLLESKKPLVVLSDGTLPPYLQNDGGWDNRKTADSFLQYAQICFQELSDSAELWVTFEELTSEFFELSRNSGKFTLPKKPELQRLHNMLVAHGKTVRLFKAKEYFGKIGIGLSCASFIPATPTKADKKAAKAFDLLCNRWVPVMLDRGMYPYFSTLALIPIAERPSSKKEDPETIATVMDFVLLSFHGGIMVSEQKTDEILRYRHSEEEQERSSLLYVMRKMYRKMKLPAFIWDKRPVNTDSAEETSLTFSQLEQLLLDWTDIRGYYITCKDLSVPTAQYHALLSYAEKQL